MFNNYDYRQQLKTQRRLLEVLSEIKFALYFIGAVLVSLTCVLIILLGS